jgi:hypothetical protein
MKTNHERNCLGTTTTPTIVPGESIIESVPVYPICQFNQLVIRIKMVLKYPIKYAILITIVTGHVVYLLCVVFGTLLTESILHDLYFSMMLVFIFQCALANIFQTPRLFGLRSHCRPYE